jgi:hypothetical protein
MPARFLDLVKLDQLFQEMLSNEIGTVDQARRAQALKGAYAFFDEDKPIYVGRTSKRGLGPRMQNHVSAQHNQGVLAFKRARASFVGKTTTRAALTRDEVFKQLFRQEIVWVKNLRCRFVEIEDDNMQYVFEFYAAVRLDTPYNDFGTH